MVKLLKYKKILRKNNMYGFVVLLVDGRCAYVDIKSHHVEVDILISSLMASGAFEDCSDISEDIVKKIINILKNPKSIYVSDSAKEYVLDKDFKDKVDKLFYEELI